MSKKFDTIIIGSGPNGLSAAITLQRKGLKTAIYEQAAIPGGATRTAEITLPGYRHDLGSAIHPLAYASPAFSQWPLNQFGLEWIQPDIPYAHPFSDGSAYACYRQVDQTAEQLGLDQLKYIKLMTALLSDWQKIKTAVLRPLHWPAHPFALLRFGIKAIQPASWFVDRYFKNEKTKLFFYGAAAHSTLPLHFPASASFGLVLNLLAHDVGWPFPRGGADAIAKALVEYYLDLGGKLHLNSPVDNLKEIPHCKTLIMDLTPRQILQLKGTEFSWLYRKRLENFRYGAGIFKMDWAMNRPIPFTDPKCSKAGTIHLGFSRKEVEDSEKVIHQGRHYEKPYVLLAQHTVFDSSRAPNGKHTAWAYCHVPLGSDQDMTDAIESQIEIEAPGFRSGILKRTVHDTQAMQQFNPNLVGGDINGGRQDISQLFTRPVAKVSPYRTGTKGIYICSSSTPPGGGVHGMGGYNAAQQVIKDFFR